MPWHSPPPKKAFSMNSTVYDYLGVKGRRVEVGQEALESNGSGVQSGSCGVTE
jgi:hypothetical protein